MGRAIRKGAEMTDRLTVVMINCLAFAVNAYFALYGATPRLSAFMAGMALMALADALMSGQR